MAQSIKAKGVKEHIQGLGLQAIYLQSSKEEAKQKERYQTKVSQDGECKNKSSPKGFTKGQPRQRWYNYWGGRHFHCSISKFIKKGGKGFAYISDFLPPSLALALSDSESLSDSDSDQWQTWNCDII